MNQNHTLPTDIDDFLLQVQLICLAFISTLAIVCFMLSGGMRMMGFRSLSNTWNQNIVKGLIQVLMAPAIVGIIASIARLLISSIAHS